MSSASILEPMPEAVRCVGLAGRHCLAPPAGGRTSAFVPTIPRVCRGSARSCTGRRCTIVNLVFGGNARFQSRAKFTIVHWSKFTFTGGQIFHFALVFHLAANGS